MSKIKNREKSNSVDLLDNDKKTSFYKSSMGVTSFEKAEIPKALETMNEAWINNTVKYLAVKEKYTTSWNRTKASLVPELKELFDAEMLDHEAFYNAAIFVSDLDEMYEVLAANKRSLFKMQTEDLTAFRKHTYHDVEDMDIEEDEKTLEDAFDACEEPEELVDWLKTYAYKSGVQEVVNELSDSWDITLDEEERKSQMLERIEELCESAIEDESTDDLFEAIQEAILKHIEVKPT
jgi:hypothetical protein